MWVRQFPISQNPVAATTLDTLSEVVYSMHTQQELLGDMSVETTMVDLHLMNQGIECNRSFAESVTRQSIHETRRALA